MPREPEGSAAPEAFRRRRCTGMDGQPRYRQGGGDAEMPKNQRAKGAGKRSSRGAPALVEKGAMVQAGSAH